jgi:hypothetical protein
MSFMMHKSSYEPKVIFVYSCIPADNERKQLNLLAVYYREVRGVQHRFLWCDLCSGIINMSTEDQGETKLQVALRLRGTLSLKEVIRAIEPFDWPYTLAFFQSSLIKGGYSLKETKEIFNGFCSQLEAANSSPSL